MEQSAGTKIIEIKSKSLAAIFSKKGKIKIQAGTIVQIPVSLIQPDPHQPRKFFHSERLKELADSYEESKDVEEAIKVVVQDNFFLIVDGERRFRAAKIAGLEKISCQICEIANPNNRFLKSVKLNMCHEAMSLIEQAYAVRDIMNRFGWHQTRAAKEIGINPGYASNIMRFLNLHKEIQALVLSGKIGNGIAFNLASYHPNEQMILLKHIKNKAKEKNGPIHPNEAARLLRNKTEELGIKPITRSTKGRTYTSHADMIVSDVSKKLSNFQKSLTEFAKIDGKLKEIPGGKLISLLNELKHVSKLMSDRIQRLNDFL